MASELTTYTGKDVIKPDVLPLVEILTAKENWFLTNLPKSTATSTIHQTLTDTLRTTASAAVAEEGDYTNLERTTPSLISNIVEIIAIPFRVTNTAAQVQFYHNENELARQTTKALIEWANAAEFDLVRSTLVSGTSGTAPKMNRLLTRFLKHIKMEVWRQFANRVIKNSIPKYQSLKRAKENFVPVPVMAIG